MVKAFKIRREQTEAFRRQAEANFESRAIQHLRRDLTEQTVPFTDEQLRQRTRDCIRRAAVYELVTERQIMCFVDVTFLLGCDFDSNPEQAWTQKVLQDRKFSPADRANLLLATACSVVRDVKGTH